MGREWVAGSVLAVVMAGIARAETPATTTSVWRPSAAAIAEAKALVDEAPKPVKEGIDRDEAERLKGELEEAGGTVELK